MKITHHGHSCVVVEAGAPGGGRLVIDPGAYSEDLSGVDRVDAALFTHAHVDHVDQKKLDELRKNSPDLELYGPEAVKDLLSQDDIGTLTVLTSSDRSELTIAGIDISVHTHAHATVYPGLLEAQNNCYLIGGRVWHPGDSFVLPPSDVDLVLVPAAAPWLKLSDAINYLRAVAAPMAMPIHQAGLGPQHRALHHTMLEKYAPKGCRVVIPDFGVPVSI
jgi:L-ascorbate metabolism protein UlaG (beta-lactamase superfamily)